MVSDHATTGSAKDAWARMCGPPLPSSVSQGSTSLSLCHSSSPRKDRTMSKLGNALVKFLKNEDGPTAVEYAVMLALIIVVCIAAITTLGQNANNTFSFVAGKVAPTGS